MALIDFRYHLVSLTAVFLALAVGVVVGVSTLSGPVAEALRGRVHGLTADKANLQGQLQSAQGRASDDERFARLVAPALVAGKLAGSTVLVISAPTGGCQRLCVSA